MLGQRPLRVAAQGAPPDEPPARQLHHARRPGLPGTSHARTVAVECCPAAVPRVVVAPDTFRGSLQADEVARCVRDGLLAVRPDLDVVVLPVADGGEGTLLAALAAGFERVPVTAAGPTGEPRASAYARRGTLALVACDVDNPLPGPAGAAAVYAPQKGAGPAEVALLDDGLTAWADLVAATTGRDLRDAPGAGAAGGVGFAALAVLGARLRPGIELVLELVGFAETLAGAALVVVGEGSLDEQSLRGKAVVGVAGVARAAGVPVVAVCGRSTLDDAQVRGAGLDAAYALLDLEPDPEVCMRDAAGLLPRLAARIVTDGRLGPRS